MSKLSNRWGWAVLYRAGFDHFLSQVGCGLSNGRQALPYFSLTLPELDIPILAPPWPSPPPPWIPCCCSPPWCSVPAGTPRARRGNSGTKFNADVQTQIGNKYKCKLWIFYLLRCKSCWNSWCWIVLAQWPKAGFHWWQYGYGLSNGTGTGTGVCPPHAFWLKIIEGYPT